MLLCKFTAKHCLGALCSVGGIEEFRLVCFVGFYFCFALSNESPSLTTAAEFGHGFGALRDRVLGKFTCSTVQHKIESPTGAENNNDE